MPRGRKNITKKVNWDHLRIKIPEEKTSPTNSNFQSGTLPSGNRRDPEKKWDSSFELFFTEYLPLLWHHCLSLFLLPLPWRCVGTLPWYFCWCREYRLIYFQSQTAPSPRIMCLGGYPKLYINAIFILILTNDLNIYVGYWLNILIEIFASQYWYWVLQ